MVVIQRGGGERTIELGGIEEAGDMAIQRSPGAERAQLNRPSPTSSGLSSPSSGPKTPGRGATLSGLENSTEARDEVRALVRLMIKKGIFTKEEFLKELQEVMLY